MFCSSCGVAISQQLKYCNRCGARLLSAKSADKPREKRLDEYLDGLFWISVFGIAVVLGGMALLKKLGLSDWIILGYVIVSSLIFLLNFGLNLREVLRMTRISREKSAETILTGMPVAELSDSSVNSFDSVASVTENTTRELTKI